MTTPKHTEGDTTYDVAVVGAGMAGLTAAIYCQRFKLTSAVLAMEVGGVVTESALVENWPGTKSVSGFELMERVREQAASLGAEFLSEEVTSIEGAFGEFRLKAASGKSVKARTIIVATGSRRRKLGVPGEAEFVGRGVSYCATCDAFFFRGKTVGVVGGSDSAAAAAELLSQFAGKVYIFYRREHLRAEPIRVERIEHNPKMQIVNRAVVTSIRGDETVKAVTLEDGREFAVDGVFIEIGFDPSRKLSDELGLALDESGFIMIDEGCRTNVDGVYAAGDVTTGSNRMRQLVTAAAEGAIAAESVYEDIKREPLEF